MIGQQLGAFRIVREIGRGGMGTVWLGRHVTLGHDVAIKVMLADRLEDREALQRFMQEARLVASIKSPGVVQILDFGSTADGAPYLVMELLVGETLRARLRTRGALDADDAAAIARQIATSLADAHAAGVIHRDLKPDNVMLVPDPEAASGERAKILDFGIAKPSFGGSDSSVETRTGSLIGTPHYMSPEQCRGTGEIDARADVYALGCILFELVCGRPPFLSQGMGEIVGMHQFVPPPSPRSIRGDVPEWMEEVILRALAKAPERRFADMDELARALEGGGAPAAQAGRFARASDPMPLDATRTTPASRRGAVALAETVATPSGDADTAVALAETMATPGAQAIAAAEVVEVPSGAHDIAALTADAQRRALALAESMAQQQRAKGSKLGQRTTIIAVAVVVLASLALYVRTGGKVTTPDGDGRRHADKGDKGGHEPRVAEPGVSHGSEDHGGAGGGGITLGSGSGTGTHAVGSGAGTGHPLEPIEPIRDAGVGVPVRVDAGAGRPPLDARVASSPHDAREVPDARPSPRDASTDPDDDPEVKRYMKLLEDASALYKAGKQTAAIELVEQANAIFPDDIESLQMLVVMWCHRGGGAEARRYYKRIVASDARRRWMVDECRSDGVVLPEP